tara:strand:+ start:140 stop:388 length:249 start_codon:yes stop_codon:yes gene_type:complete
MRKYKKSIRKQRKTIRKRKTKKRKTIRKQVKIRKKSIIQFESDYQNLRLRYLRAKKKRSTDENNELSYLESLLKYLQKKQTN